MPNHNNNKNAFGEIESNKLDKLERAVFGESDTELIGIIGQLKEIRQDIDDIQKGKLAR